MKTSTVKHLIFLILCILIQSETLLRKTTEDYIKEAKYPFETHEILTKDGYYLTLHRVLPNSNQTISGRYPILLVHPLPSSGAVFVIQLIDSQKGMAFQLSDYNFDVWILHHRGTPESPRHITFDRNDKQYWEFNLDILASFDLAETVDYVLDKTGKEKTHLLSVSQGTTVFFALVAGHPEYNEKLASGYLIVPAGSFHHIDPLILQTINNPTLTNSVINIIGFLNIHYLPLCNDEIKNILDNLLLDELLTNILKYSISIVMGRFDPHVDFAGLLTKVINTCSDIPVNILKHYLQAGQNKNLRQFDYGRETNLEKYGKKTPPIYNLSLISIPITLAGTTDDRLAAPQDTYRLKSKLKNARIVKFPGNHISWAVTPKTINGIHRDFIKFMKMLEKGKISAI